MVIIDRWRRIWFQHRPLASWLNDRKLKLFWALSLWRLAHSSQRSWQRRCCS